jgi:hypothetical protein
MSGKVCFDTKETFGNTVSGSTNGLSANRTETASPTPQGTQDYVLTVTGKTISTVTWVADVTKFYSSTAASGTNNTTFTTTFADLEQIIKPAVQDGYKATASNGQVITITAYVNFTDGTKGSISKVVKIQDYICCEGWICVGCAYDYSAQSSVSGAGAPGYYSVSTPASNTSFSYTSIKQGLLVYSGAPDSVRSFDTTTDNTYFAPVGDLCVYKKDTPATDWANGVNNCRSGMYTNSAADTWYLPNERELFAIYMGLPGTNGSAKTGTAALFGGAADAQPMGTFGWYNSSTEYTATRNYLVKFSDGTKYITTPSKGSSYYSRCVSRL